MYIVCSYAIETRVRQLDAIFTDYADAEAYLDDQAGIVGGVRMELFQFDMTERTIARLLERHVPLKSVFGRDGGGATQPETD